MIDKVYLTYDTSKVNLSTAYTESEVQKMLQDNISVSTNGVRLDKGNSGLYYYNGSAFVGVGQGPNQITVERTYYVKFQLLHPLSGYDWSSKEKNTSAIQFYLNGTLETPGLISYNSYWNEYSVFFKLGEPERVGWLNIDGKWYYYNEKNEAVTGWNKISSKWYYMDASGTMLTGWQKIGGKWYYLGTNGAMLTGWQQIGGKWYYLGTNGAMLTGWQQIGGKWYYLGTNGAMLTGWQQIGGKWYYLGTNGIMKTGWQQIGGKWYYLGTNGVMKTGWQQIGGKWYYFGTNGVMKTGWLQLGSTWYYLKSSGVMACNETLTINGKTYTFSSTGAWIR